MPESESLQIGPASILTIEQELKQTHFKLSLWNAPELNDRQGLPFNIVRGTNVALLCFNPCKIDSLTLMTNYKHYFDKLGIENAELALIAIVPKGFVQTLQMNLEMIESYAEKMALQLSIVMMDESDRSFMNPLECIEQFCRKKLHKPTIIDYPSI